MQQMRRCQCREQVIDGGAVEKIDRVQRNIRPTRRAAGDTAACTS
jgi:hypothetical protein